MRPQNLVCTSSFSHLAILCQFMCSSVAALWTRGHLEIQHSAECTARVIGSLPLIQPSAIQACTLHWSHRIYAHFIWILINSPMFCFGSLSVCNNISCQYQYLPGLRLGLWLHHSQLWVHNVTVRVDSCHFSLLGSHHTLDLMEIKLAQSGHHGAPCTAGPSSQGYLERISELFWRTIKVSDWR